MLRSVVIFEVAKVGKALLGGEWNSKKKKKKGGKGGDPPPAAS